MYSPTGDTGTCITYVLQFLLKELNPTYALPDIACTKIVLVLSVIFLSYMYV